MCVLDSAPLKEERALTEAAGRRRLPPWIRSRLPGGPVYNRLKGLMRSEQLATVCEEARCPNLHECWSAGTLTVMIMGEVCTRGCRFCSVKTGNPGGLLDHDEPRRLAKSLSALKLAYVVFTSVDRDDVPDAGADHFRRAILEVREHCPWMKVEVLTPDFGGVQERVELVAKAQPDVFAHNIETVERLHRSVRDVRAGYQQSLDVLDWARAAAPSVVTKSSIMLGHGESEAEVLTTMRALRDVGVSILTLGQYLRPSKRQLEVVEYLEPARFDRYRELGEELGFDTVASGPLVRSSYRAAEVFAGKLLAVPGDGTNRSLPMSV